MSFSKRLGITPQTKPLQLESMDSDLKNSLWNAIYMHVLEYAQPNRYNNLFEDLRQDLTINFFKIKLSSMPNYYLNLVEEVEDFFGNAPWYKIYDLLDFFIGKGYTNSEEYIQDVNRFLEKEFSAYRIINYEIAPISNELEINSLKESLEICRKYTAFDSVNIHLSRALSSLSDRENPNYANSIKESVSAVESVARVITKEGTLGNALNKLEQAGLVVSSQLKESFNKIYNYTNDKSSGIRHAVIEGHKPPDFETAKYILITSSAFVNYLVSLAQKAGLI